MTLRPGLADDVAMLTRAFALLLALAAVACGGRTDSSSQATPAEVEAETARLNEWFEARWEEELSFSPIRKTFLGRKDDYDKLDELSEQAEDEQLAWRRKTVEELKASFDYAKLTPEARTSYDLWVYQLDQAERGLPFRRRHYVFTQMQGAQVALPQVLVVFHRVDEPSDMEAYVSRLGHLGRAVDQLLERARVHASEGVRPPKFAYEGVITQARGVITGEPFGGKGQAPLWADALGKIASLEKAGKIDAAKAGALRDGARQALLESVKPAYDRLIAWFEQDMPNADVIATGVGKLPQGREFYNQALEEATTTKLTADEVHQIGLDEVARIQKEMEAIKTSVGFKGTLQEFFAFMRTDPKFYFPNTDEGREAYLQEARDHLAFIQERLPQYFGILPKAPLEVRRVEPFREQPGAAQHYFPGTPDGSRPGIYYNHLSDMKAMPRYELETVAYHEGNPGHHMQVSIAQELEGVPTFRTQSNFNAYSEGWGLYAELLGKEMGAFKDPYSDFGRLAGEIWRAVRLVVDTGLHSKGWTEQQAVDYFLANSSSAEGAVRSEIQRYIVWPGQATGYKIGMLRILEMRENARKQLGDKFDIRGFHDTVLGGGALPLELLERRVQDWVKQVSAGS